MTRILLIDDDQDIIDNLQLILEANGYEVAYRMNTENLIDGVMQTNPDLIILDIMFPEDPQAGFVAARELRKHPKVKGIPVLLLSAVNQRSNMAFGFSEADISEDFMPVEAFIEKPVQPADLLERIKNLLSTPSAI